MTDGNNKVNFEPSGLLSKHENTLNGVHLKYSRPEDSCKPDKRWKLYHFRYDEGAVEDDDHRGRHAYHSTIPLYNEEYHIIGNDSRVVGIKIRDDTVDEQHAVIQFKYGRKGTPGIYIIDTDSRNGTYINNERLDSKRFYQLFEKDIIRFGMCKDEFVLLNDEMG
ncbi:fork head domain protein [Cryptosporidium ryanae]|uniref:fork head domain protein n=1 Tax=Cryptosporidium ryanae TaxID=515981 RepID=UPI00351AA0DE|nr:fork head domain protein [Cryptosporidium ryanae]